VVAAHREKSYVGIIERLCGFRASRLGVVGAGLRQVADLDYELYLSVDELSVYLVDD
jgi:hypothetical protein